MMKRYTDSWYTAELNYAPAASSSSVDKSIATRTTLHIIYLTCVCLHICISKRNGEIETEAERGEISVCLPLSADVSWKELKP